MEEKKIEKYSESIYKEFRKLKVCCVDDDLIKDRSNRLDTNYNIYNLKENKIVLQGMNSECFERITRKEWVKDNFESDLRLDLFIPSSSIRLDHKTFIRFINKVRILGKFKFRKIKNYRLNYNYNQSEKGISLRKKENVFLFQLNFKDFENMETIKMITHTLRNTYEIDLYKKIKYYFSVIDSDINKNIKIPFISTFYSIRKHLSGHDYTIFPSILSDEQALEKINSWNKNDYNNNIMNNLSNILSLGYSFVYNNSWNYRDQTCNKYLMGKNLVIKKEKSYKEYVENLKMELSRQSTPYLNEREFKFNNHE